MTLEHVCSQTGITGQDLYDLASVEFNRITDLHMIDYEAAGSFVGEIIHRHGDIFGTNYGEISDFILTHASEDSDCGLCYEIAYLAVKKEFEGSSGQLNEKERESWAETYETHKDTFEQMMQMADERRKLIKRFGQEPDYEKEEAVLHSEFAEKPLTQSYEKFVHQFVERHQELGPEFLTLLRENVTIERTICKGYK